MSPTTHSPSFDTLSAAFMRAFPSGHWDGFAALGIQSDNMLTLAAGMLGLGRFTAPQALSPAQQSQDMGLASTFDTQRSDPLAGLHNALPLDALRRLSDHIRAWDPPDTRLQTSVLKESEISIVRARRSLDPLFENGSWDQKTVVLELGNIANMADVLERLTAQGLTNRAGFRAAFSNMPILDELPEWAAFRQDSLS